MLKAPQIGKIIAFLFFGFLLTSCFTYKPFSNLRRGKAMDPEEVRAKLKPGAMFRIKLVDSREVMVKVKTIDEKQVMGDLAISDYGGDNFRHSELKPGGVILIRNISEIERRRFSLGKTLILGGAGLVVYLIVDYGQRTSYK